MGWHMLRHTFASHLVIRERSDQGHASIEMTMRDAHLSPDARRDAVGLLDLAASPAGVRPAAETGSDA
jgi:integrase